MKFRNLGPRLLVPKPGNSPASCRSPPRARELDRGMRVVVSASGRAEAAVIHTNQVSVQGPKEPLGGRTSRTPASRPRARSYSGTSPTGDGSTSPAQPPGERGGGRWRLWQVRVYATRTTEAAHQSSGAGQRRREESTRLVGGLLPPFVPHPEDLAVAEGHIRDSSRVALRYDPAMPPLATSREPARLLVVSQDTRDAQPPEQDRSTYWGAALRPLQGVHACQTAAHR
jgi:hypothetical protein